MSKEFLFSITSSDTPVRLDVYLSQQIPELSRSHIQILMEQGHILLNNKSVKPSHKIYPGNKITVILPDPEALDTEAEEIPLSILYEDEQLLVVNKPAGMVVHPAAGNKQGTLVNALLYHCKNLSGIGGVQRPGIVHRLDKGTSGLIMVAKTDLAHHSLSSQLKQRTIVRRYLALVYGNIPQKEGLIETYIGRHATDRLKMAVKTEGGRIAGTYYTVLQHYSKTIQTIQTSHHGLYHFTYVECKLTTGRTHQIRVHLSHLGFPIVGDATYGKGRAADIGKKFTSLINKLNGFALHAQVLGFAHPVTEKYLEFSAPPPPAFQNLLDYLKTS